LNTPFKFLDYSKNPISGLSFLAVCRLLLRFTLYFLLAGSPFYHLESLKKKDAFLKELFKNVCFYTSPVPTYPGGSWCFVFLSDESQPLKIKRDPPRGLKYFNLDIHQAAFSLPNFLRGLGYRCY